MNNNLSLENIEITVLNDTRCSIEQICKLTGMTSGELIDRLVLKWEPRDPMCAAQLILDSIVIYTRKMNDEQFDKTIAVVFNVLKECLKKDGLKSLRGIFEQFETALGAKNISADDYDILKKVFQK
ncbi:MAG: hypothetical protein J6K66_03475 [Clostridia bacterium]|nr:hypothetical protein [Clostridia bacterium]